MNTAIKLTGAAVAAAAAALLMTGCNSTYESSEATAEAMVKCSGINACKGTSACKTATNACKGQNSCKGHGWIKASEEECTSKGGTVLG
ncbi:MAG: hypothetical protein QNL62_07480 [Gammaproteobacteria bacterium]|nr:hypothetical protein [Gammaproteobacteria bacterium]